MKQPGVAFTTHDVQNSWTWREELIAKLKDGLDKLYMSLNHNLPDVEASEDVRLPESVKKIHDDDIMMMRAPNLQRKKEDGSYCNNTSQFLAGGPGPAKETTKRFRVSPNNHRHPCYVVVSISKINDIKSAAAFFDLRVRLSLLFEFDLVGAGFEKWVDAACESQTGFLPLLKYQMEMLRDLGIVIPKMVFLNAISQQDVRPVETRVYPRWEKSKLECITCSRMWDVQFRQQFDLRDFPFDSQDLVLELSMMDSEPAHIMDRFHLVVYSVQYKQDLVNLPEWRVHLPRIQRRLPLHRRMNIHIRVSRQPQYYLWNIIFVAFMISTLGFTVFMESWENTSERVSIVLTLLLTNITFQYNVSSQLPKLCYFTLLDGYTFRMTVSLFLLSFGCCAAKFHEYFVYNVDSVDLLDSWDPESIDLLASFVFGTLYLLANIQWLWLVLRNCFRFCDDILSNSQFGEASRNAPIWLCFMFGYPFFLGAPEDGQFQPLKNLQDRVNAVFESPKTPRTPARFVFPKTPLGTPDASPERNRPGTPGVSPAQSSEDIANSSSFSSLMETGSPETAQTQCTRPATEDVTSADSHGQEANQTQCSTSHGTTDKMSRRSTLGTRLRLDSRIFSSRCSSGSLDSFDPLVGG